MQAVLILAHKNIDQVIELASRLSTDFEIYIHLDKKAKITVDQSRKIKKITKGYISKYDVKWGSYSIVKATIDLMKMALNNNQNTYFHLISGQDWPLMSPAKIYEYFEHTNQIYMNYWPAVSMRKTGEPEIWWTKYYFNYDSINRRTTFGKVYHRLLLFVQTVLRINKLDKYGLKEDYIYAGKEWVDIPRDALEFAITYYEQHPNLEKIFSTSFCSDEMWLQTILCNSEFKPRIEKNIHHYIEMTEKHGSRPAILDEEDYSKIISGNYWWGRKVERPISDKLINLLDEKS
ncbi:beta-1,6-N-acetylglucosaminyltransferase [Limosilactobacillus reuteri]|uniref:beta-1,6-N-acetylglucosaminyltransferase n=1 Tax=Limosilactobacillus reuteri TaxID=1598 RepID=UPI001E451D6B|nr:beta-1,6-N-acetylglucosaminyltransferase [Limosilactobacillus reuteri]MCC4340794.1 beta-1,6-N-acetylglucosaminyltransferase [Limosilactobacillus reuteri]MCC4350808.1 beta-1,6-N-acetylglucosaminyltransferase [Limosilactobacillus reuteri]MCC4359839.1 beta-1,6-N-acetylglucosaminyltransferase [Limosilactobacillus reuteri]MCC4378590.1 beta-1,6-N-acetylglucosaminyltransferase [Limosilactobacillus reuteri]MCC4408388.1 beta-1,6-N-acetylglucosaminyltransferase [Limosilactobacillus reuteri]